MFWKLQTEVIWIVKAIKERPCASPVIREQSNGWHLEPVKAYKIKRLASTFFSKEEIGGWHHAKINLVFCLLDHNLKWCPIIFALSPRPTYKVAEENAVLKVQMSYLMPPLLTLDNTISKKWSIGNAMTRAAKILHKMIQIPTWPTNKSHFRS